MQNPNENNLPIIQQNNLQIVDNQLTITDLLLGESEDKELREWWEGLLQYKNVSHKFVHYIKETQYTYQHIFNLHIELMSKNFDFNNDLLLKSKIYNLSADCFYIYYKELGCEFDVNGITFSKNFKEKIHSIHTWYLKNLGLNSIEPLKELTNSKIIYVNQNSITSVTPLENLTSLIWLHIDDNNISDLMSLKKLENLRIFSCSRNPIHSLSVIPFLINLYSLNCSRNFINDLYDLKDLKKLKRLNVSKNEISSLEPLKDIDLKDLNCSNNKINNIDILQYLVNLEDLDFSNNVVSNLLPLTNLTKLRTLYCEGNPIPSSEIEKFKTLHPNCTVYHD